MDKSINVVSLFSGCGGLDIGIANSGENKITTDFGDQFEFVWSNDAMKHATKTHSMNLGKPFIEDRAELGDNKVSYCGDIRDINFHNAVPVDEKEVNLLVGGFPCQDFSILRGDENRKGIEVKRGKLYLEFARGLASLQPDMFIAENVKGLISANDGKAYERIMKDFKNLDKEWDNIQTEYKKEKNRDTRVETNNISGYKILHSEVIDFSKLGVPQGRERLIIIGLREDLISEVESKTDNNISNISKSIKNNLNSYNIFKEAPLTTMETFHGTNLKNLKTEYESVMKMYEDYIDKLDSERAIKYRDEIWPKYTFNIWEDYKWKNNINKGLQKDQINSEHENILKELGYWNKNIAEHNYSDDSNEEMREQDRVLERLRHIPPSENHRMVKNTEHHISAMMSNIYKRVHPLKVSPTVIASGGGGTWGYHYERERGKLTNRERARLQTFPEDFLFHGTNSEVRKQIGNAVPPLGAKRIGEEIKPILKLTI